MARYKNALETSGCTTPTLQIRYFKDDDAKVRHQTLKGRKTLPEKGFDFKGTSTEGFPPSVMATICWDIIRKNKLQRDNKILCPTRDPCTRTENRRKS
ncbi:hypothetical protein GQ457_07G005510 [Hibiscus cannabinus]